MFHRNAGAAPAAHVRDERLIVLAVSVMDRAWLKPSWSPDPLRIDGGYCVLERTLNHEHQRPAFGRARRDYRLLIRAAAQSSHRSPGTRSNPRTLDVTSVAPSRRACPASSTSYAPMGVPRASSSALTVPASFASSSSNGVQSSGPEQNVSTRRALMSLVAALGNAVPQLEHDDRGEEDCCVVCERSLESRPDELRLPVDECDARVGVEQVAGRHKTSRTGDGGWLRPSDMNGSVAS